MKSQINVTIPQSFRVNKRHVIFSLEDLDARGQSWMGTADGSEQDGGFIEVRKQIDADNHEYSRVKVIAVARPVTGDVVLTLEPARRSVVA